jgi:uncharacterized membrane protein
MKPSKEQQNQQSSISVSRQQLFAGPVPSPDLLEKYEQIQPGFADRLIKMAEKEQEHRLKSQEKLIDGERELSNKELANFKRGQIFAILSVFIIVSLCVFIFYRGYKTEGRDIAVAVIIGLAGIFISGRFNRKKGHNKE